MAEEIETKKRPALSGWPMILAWLAMLIFAFHASTHMVGAGDTWVAMACGRHFINQGVDTVEPFSANSHRPGPTSAEIKSWPGWAQSIAGKFDLKTVKYWHPTGWVNQNWLTHVIFYWLTHESPFADPDTFPPSFNQLVYWKIIIYILTVICVYYTGRILGANPALSAFFACFAMFVGRSFFDVRPAGFSNLLVAVFLLILVLTTYRNILYIWLIVPVVTFWCNVHGGYIYAFIMLVPFVVLNLLTSFSKRRFVSIGLKGIYHTIAAGFVAFIATIVFNPFHLTNLTHTFTISVSEHAKMWRTVNEWHPAFNWSNPVGTSFPFLVLFVLSIGLTLLWLFSRLLKPRFLKAPRNEFEAQKKLFTTLSRIIGCAAAVLICWVILITFSLLNLSAVDFIICAAFVGVLLLSIYKNVHFISLIIPLTLLALWASNAKAGYNGRYIYPFVLLPAYVTLHIFASLFSKNVKIEQKNIIFAAATAVVALLLIVVIFNPFNFLFNVGLKFQSHLDNGIISEELRQEFEENEAPLSQDVTVSLEEAGSRWLITDKSRKYYVRKEQRRLHISASPLWHIERLLHPHRLHRMLRPVYERNVEVTYTNLFNTLYIVSIASIIIWLMVPYLRKLFTQVTNKIDIEHRASSIEHREFQLPKIDLALIVVAALTIYMAVRSRRFIPIAAFAACPILAMLIDQMVRTISAARNFHNQNRLTVSPMPQVLQLFFIVVGAAAVLIFGTGWGLKFKRVYLDAWPTDTKLNSAFMRMTASDAKPFYACKFIRDNKIEGKIFNYWTEGGFIAYGQHPDPNTGRTPLQLFMDGRAQAAYEPAAYKLWSDIMSGGPTFYAANQKAKLTGRTVQQILTRDDYIKIGTWIDKQLKSHKVWVVLMPTGQFETLFVKRIEQNPDWPVVFFNDKQKLFVDRTTPKGKQLFEGIFNGKTRYPDDFSRSLVLAHNLFLFYSNDKTGRKQALDLAINAFKLNQSQAPIREIMFATRFPELRPRAEAFAKKYFDDFAKNKDIWAKQHSYHHRIAAALNVCSYFQELARRQKDTKLMQSYADKRSEYHSERKELLKRKRW